MALGAGDGAVEEWLFLLQDSALFGVGVSIEHRRALRGFVLRPLPPALLAVSAISWDCTAGYAEPGVAVAVGRAVVVAARDTAVARAVVPIAASEHPGRARSWAGRIRHRVQVIVPIPVGAPFPRIT